ncbi:MAG: hypothetical protein OEY20_04485 [Gemmatimonadota bacterium]|nr:hypothetical protein [Gemmatimonadota bacterium]MDH5196486.1 hypothetical protein [Gemmatimonadota bacterium]
MTRLRTGSILAGLTALGFLGTAVLHSTGFPAVTELAADVPSDLGPLMPALWLVFSLDLTVLGLIIAVVTWRPAPIGRPILAIAALSPLGTAILQLATIGFVPPTAILCGIAVLALVAAAVLPGASRPMAP